MTTQIDQNVADYAIISGNQTGLDPHVILAQMDAENNQNLLGTQYWVNNNPMNIRPGNPNVDAYASGRSPNGFDIFPNPAAGMDAYSVLMLDDPNYAGVRQAIQSGSPTKELQAIVSSPFDSTHYTANGVKGESLYDAYKAVTGKTVAAPTATDNQTLNQTASQVNPWNSSDPLSGVSSLFGKVWNINTLFIVGGALGVILILVNIAKGGNGVNFA